MRCNQNCICLKDTLLLTYDTNSCEYNHVTNTSFCRLMYIILIHEELYFCTNNNNNNNNNNNRKDDSDVRVM